LTCTDSNNNVYTTVETATSGTPNQGVNYIAPTGVPHTSQPTAATYTEGAIGCAGCTAIQALVKWVQKGFTPQNPALWCSGHDGEAIGAVPFCASGKVMIGTLAGM
jgi:hypothetical protein